MYLSQLLTMKCAKALILQNQDQVIPSTLLYQQISCHFRNVSWQVWHSALKLPFFKWWTLRWSKCKHSTITTANIRKMAMTVYFISLTILLLHWPHPLLWPHPKKVVEMPVQRVNQTQEFLVSRQAALFTRTLVVWLRQAQKIRFLVFWESITVVRLELILVPCLK